ncbi:MAG: hypothetical protein NT023_11125 [Armatimonadetes bacterium]|nr:hypothetical protein [Armatimonadota bacterium]
MNRRSDDEHTDEERDVQYLERLVRSLELSEGFSLYFAVCNQRPRVLKLMKRAEAEFPPDTVLRVAIEKPIISLRDYLLDAIEQTEKPPRALFVYGLESWIGKPEAPRAPLFLGMNTIRNFFAQTVNRSLVFWIPEYLYLGMLRAAPDFCSVRSGIYYFADSLPDQSRTELLTSGDQTGVMGLSLEEREQRIKDLTELLEEYRSVSEEMRDWTQGMDIMRRQNPFYLRH